MKLLQCSHCEHIGTDIDLQPGHVGGHTAQVWKMYCTDNNACWKRWDKKHLMKGRSRQCLVKKDRFRRHNSGL